MSGIFITGTDTGIGKTLITGLLARLFKEQGHSVGIFKPISCGPQRDNDALLLKKLLKLKDPLSLINPISLPLPLSPLAAAQLSKKTIRLNKIFAAYKKLKKKYATVLIEGVGGALVPITKKYLVADLIADLKTPTIIVARAGLGTLNHTLLTVEALRRRNILILGIILNGYTGQDQSEKTNGQLIEELTGIPILAKLPWQK